MIQKCGLFNKGVRSRREKKLELPYWATWTKIEKPERTKDRRNSEKVEYMSPDTPQQNWSVESDALNKTCQYLIIEYNSNNNSITSEISAWPSFNDYWGQRMPPHGSDYDQPIIRCRHETPQKINPQNIIQYPPTN